MRLREPRVEGHSRLQAALDPVLQPEQTPERPL